MIASVTTRSSSKRFTQQESERRSVKRPQALTAAQHRALCKQLKNVHFLKLDYANNTKINIAGILRKWKKVKKPLPFHLINVANRHEDTANLPSWWGVGKR
ncbi:hypothetical protein QBC46DRAFT_413854 [Diplogelasinospora grovesii]|uniref:Uncharacterized protein n=1 Tax=Diplogelasinospora grovesii TaxID=303347 RepID=A0AAN6MWT5_9PEZI|nr:hypothetical protein QBC46DRAFT_413854 [Diplogelasinospora grovesii]